MSDEVQPPSFGEQEAAAPGWRTGRADRVGEDGGGDRDEPRLVRARAGAHGRGHAVL